jgi:hypothetical protein
VIAGVDGLGKVADMIFFYIKSSFLFIGLKAYFIQFIELKLRNYPHL